MSTTDNHLPQVFLQTLRLALWNSLCLEPKGSGDTPPRKLQQIRQEDAYLTFFWLSFTDVASFKVETRLKQSSDLSLQVDLSVYGLTRWQLIESGFNSQIPIHQTLITGRGGGGGTQKSEHCSLYVMYFFCFSQVYL